MKTVNLLLIFLLPILINAQDVIYTVSGQSNNEKVALNAIHFENLSNGNCILFDSLPEVADYQINLTKKSYWGTTEIKALGKQSKFIISQNIPGKLVVSYKDGQGTKLRVSIFNMNGQKVYSSVRSYLQGNNLIRIQLGPSQLFLVRFETGWGTQTFKVVGSESINDYRVEISDGQNHPGLKSILTDFNNEFSFSVGDSIRISAYKSGYYASPIELKVTSSQDLNFLLKESETINYLKIDDTVFNLSDGILAHLGNFEGKGVYNHDLYLLSPEHHFNFETWDSEGTGPVVFLSIFNTQEEIESGVYFLGIPEEMETEKVCDSDVNADGLINEDDCITKLREGEFYISSRLSGYDANADLHELPGMEFQSGKVIITNDGDFLTVEIDCIGKNGDRITGFYSGPVHLYEASEEEVQLTIEVMDIDRWSPVNPLGEYATNATVKLLDTYNSDKNFPLYTGTTDAEGKVVFPQIQPDNYLVYIEKGNQSNVTEKEIINGKEVGFIIDGIFQNQEEVDKSVILAGTTVGDPKLMDVNADGKLNDLDKTAGHVIAVNENASLTFFIAAFDPFANVTETDIHDTLLWCYSQLHEYIELAYLFDAVYSNNFPAPSQAWTEIEEHGQTYSSTNEKMIKLWKDAYRIIYTTNLVIKMAENVLPDSPTKNEIVAQAKTMRACLYYHLLNWFGGIPIEIGSAESMIPRNSAEDVLMQIKQDAAAAIQFLPVKWPTSELFRFPKSFAQGLLARALLNSGNNADAQALTQEIMNSGSFALSPDTTNFISTNAEMICGFEKSVNAEFTDFFTNGSFVPQMRYTEIYLIDAEALFNLGKTAKAMLVINELNARRGKPTVSSLTYEDIYQHWKTEMANEGNMFITLKRFGKALSILQNQPHKLLLPVPFSVLTTNPNMTQNPGY